MNLPNEAILDFLLDTDEEVSQKFSDYFIFDQIIGEGAFGVVVSAYKKNDTSNQKYAIKIIKKSSINENNHEKLIFEAKIIAKLHHNNIVKFYECIQTKKRVMLVMELIEGGNLKKLMEERFKKHKVFTEEETNLLMKSLLDAVKYIHSKNIVHRDLKPENILIQKKNDLSTIKIIDFGISAQYAKGGTGTSMTTQCGTLFYMAPELILEKLYNKPVDLWACGIIMYMMLAGKHPFYPYIDTTERFLKRMKNPEWSFPFNNFSEYAKNLFLKLVDPNHLNRYTADIAANHPWITRKFDEEIPLSGYEYLENIHNEQKFAYLMQAIFFIKYLQMKTCREDNAFLTLQASSPKLFRKDTYMVLVQKHTDKREKDKKSLKPSKVSFWNPKNYTELLFDIYSSQKGLKISKSRIIADEDTRNYKKSQKKIVSDETNLHNQFTQSKRFKRAETKQLLEDKNNVKEGYNNENNILNYSAKNFRQSSIRRLVNQVPSTKEINEEIKLEKESHAAILMKQMMNRPTQAKIIDNIIGLKPIHFNIMNEKIHDPPRFSKLNDKLNQSDEEIEVIDANKETKNTEDNNNIYGLYSPQTKNNYKLFKYISISPDLPRKNPDSKVLLYPINNMQMHNSPKNNPYKFKLKSIQNNTSKSPESKEHSLSKTRSEYFPRIAIPTKRFSIQPINSTNKGETTKKVPHLSKFATVALVKPSSSEIQTKLTKVGEIPTLAEELLSPSHPRYLKVTKTALQKANLRIFSAAQKEQNSGRKTMINYMQYLTKKWLKISFSI